MSRTDEKPSAQAWLTASRKGFRELSSGHVQTALSSWREASRIFASSETSDPRLAAAKNNVGVACLMLSERDEAKFQLEGALALWMQVRAGLDALDLPVAGRSSSFHFRLAIDHSDAFRAAGRKRYEQLCDAALAITRFNVALLDQRCIEQGDSGVTIESLVRGFGPGCLEISVLNSLSQDPCDSLSKDADRRTNAGLFGMYGEKLSRGAADEGAWQREPPTDAQILEAAAHMTALCDPRLCAKRRPHHD